MSAGTVPQPKPNEGPNPLMQVPVSNALTVQRSTDETLNQSLMSAVSQRVDRVSTSVNQLVKERDQHDRYHRLSTRFQYMFVILMGMLYLTYGIPRYSQSLQHHRVTTFITNTDTAYPVPVTMVCQDAGENNNGDDPYSSQSMVNITQILVDSTPMSINPNFGNPDIQFIDDPEQIVNLSKWNALQFVINKTFAYQYSRNHQIQFNVTVLFQCQILVPPKDATFSFGYLQTFLYRKTGIGAMDQSLAKFNGNYGIPQYLTKQFQFKVIHRVFHFDALLDSVRNRFPDATADRLNLSQVLS